MQLRTLRIATALLVAGCAGVDGGSVTPALRLDRVETANDGIPYYVRGDLGRIAGAVDEPRALDGVMPGIGALFGVPASDLVATEVRRDRIGMSHVVFEQRRDGLRVVGGTVVVHVASDGVVRAVTGTARDTGPRTAAALSGDDARAVARAGTAEGHADAGSAELVYVIATGDGRMHLAWEVEAFGREALVFDLVYVDAVDGAIVDRRPQVYTARSRTILDGHGGTYPFVSNTTQVGSEGQPPSDAVARAAYDNTGITYDCYAELFQRDSYDGAGALLRSLVHVKFFTPNGATGNNAAWTGDRMVYGDGDGNLMGPLALAVDVTAHELTHGVTSATAKLAYQNEPGALNEGMSDIMAAVCEAWHDGAVSADTWLVGEDVFTPATAGDAMRYMANPTADAALYPPELGGSRDFYADRYQGNQDNGGVHLNSGIPNLAFQLLVEGGTHPRGKTTFAVTGIGMTKAAAIFERALTQGYFTANTTLAQARTATEEVAEELFPGTGPAVGMAWAAVGIGTPPGVDTSPPTVAITSPTDGAVVGPAATALTVAVEAADDRGVLRVELSVDGVLVGTDDAAPYTFTLDAGLADGAHTIEAAAYDASNRATDAIAITVGTDTCPSEPCSGDEEPAGCGCSHGGGASPLMLGAVLLMILRRRRSRPLV